MARKNGNCQTNRGWVKEFLRFVLLFLLVFFLLFRFHFFSPSSLHLEDKETCWRNWFCFMYTRRKKRKKTSLAQNDEILWWNTFTWLLCDIKRRATEGKKRRKEKFWLWRKHLAISTRPSTHPPSHVHKKSRAFERRAFRKHRKAVSSS